MVPPISKGGGRFLGNEELKKATRIVEFSERTSDATSVFLVVVVVIVEATHRARCLSEPPRSSLRTLPPRFTLRRLPGERGERRRALRPIIFPSLRNISTPLQRTNSFYSRCRATLRQPPPHRVTSFPATRPRVAPLYPPHRQCVRTSIPTGPPLRTDRGVRIISIARTAIIHRAKKIIKCL